MQEIVLEAIMWQCIRHYIAGLWSEFKFKLKEYAFDA